MTKYLDAYKKICLSAKGQSSLWDLKRYVVGQRSTAKQLDYCVLKKNFYYYIRQSPEILLYSILIYSEIIRRT